MKLANWQENEKWHRDQRCADAEAIATGTMTPEQVQAKNSFIPVDAKIVIDWDKNLERLQRLYRQTI
jgi:hypothetical protein